MLTLACVLATAGSLSASVSAEPTGSQAQASALETATLTVDWAKVLRTSRTTATLQVVVNPPLRRGGSIHDQAFKAVKDLGCDYVRYVPWLPYPRLGVPALEPPAKRAHLVGLLADRSDDAGFSRRHRRVTPSS